MQITNYVWIALAIYNLVTGLASIFTGKVFTMGRKADQYTEESLKAYARPSGIANVIIGIGFILEFVFTQNNGGDKSSLTWGLVSMIGCLIIGLIVYFFAYKKLVKKNAQ